jgi:hypothetical protein
MKPFQSRTEEGLLGDYEARRNPRRIIIGRHSGTRAVGQKLIGDV